MTDLDVDRRQLIEDIARLVTGALLVSLESKQKKHLGESACRRPGPHSKHELTAHAGPLTVEYIPLGKRELYPTYR